MQTHTAPKIDYLAAKLEKELKYKVLAGAETMRIDRHHGVHFVEPVKSGDEQLPFILVEIAANQHKVVDAFHFGQQVTVSAPVAQQEKLGVAGVAGIGIA